MAAAAAAAAVMEGILLPVGLFHFSFQLPFVAIVWTLSMGRR